MHDIQQKLKAPKGQTNTFGKYKYRSCEDIVEAVKPILHERQLHLIISDEMINLGDRCYVKATARVKGYLEGKEYILGEATGYAREALSKKGMDEAQVTGAASSYARKYALNGLFAIDDTKDPDTQDNRDVSRDPSQDAPRSQGNVSDDEKEWYNDFDQDQAAMGEKIKSGVATADQLIKHLRSSFKVSKAVAKQITELGES